MARHSISVRLSQLSAVAALISTMAFAAPARAEGVPEWAYPINPPGLAAPKDDGQMRTLDGSTKTFSFSDLRNFFSPPDWYPDDHPAMPPLVANGAKPDSYACGFCHLPTGNGRPENANIAGLPAAYIIKQVEEMATGARKSALPDRYPQALMTKLAKQAAAEPGLKEAAEYFASLKAKAMTKIVETDTVPKIEISHWILKAADGQGTEPIGNRLVEMADDFARFDKRDGHITYTAYVPKGSIAKGEALVKTGGGKATPCAVCHGGDLKGLGPVPPIAGRSPSYTLRQLFDIRGGSRNGAWTALMKPVTAGLSDDDIVAITAYLGTLSP